MNKTKGWIGVDLDGTLAQYDTWMGHEYIGAPIPSMVDRVKQWIYNGIEVKIFTARAFEVPRDIYGKRDQNHPIIRSIERWCNEHIGVILEVTNEKDYAMIQYWDDRAVRVVENTGNPCCHNIHNKL